MVTDAVEGEEELVGRVGGQTEGQVGGQTLLHVHLRYFYGAGSLHPNGSVNRA